MPYTEIQDFPLRAFLRKDKAEALVKSLDRVERARKDKYEQLWNYHRIEELELETE